MTTSFGPEQSLKRQKELYEREQAGETVISSMSDGEIRRIEEKVKALEKLLRDKVRARYKLEIHFGKNRSSMGMRSSQPFAGAVTYWLSGTKFHGGGDEKIYGEDWSKDPPFGTERRVRDLLPRGCIQHVHKASRRWHGCSCLFFRRAPAD